MEMLLALAKSVVLPDWATHVAVRKDASKAEPAIEHEGLFLDCEPIKGEWAGSFKTAYWVLFSKGELVS